MANFPTSVFAPATRTAGQTIQPAHVNDLQDEVAAIEDGLINGTAPVHASSVTVSGGVTFNTQPYVFPASGGSSGQALVIDSTSGSTMTLKWATVGASTPDAVRVSLASTVALPIGNTTLDWGTQDYITNSSMHNTGVNSSRLTPQSTGVYFISGQVSFAGGISSGVREVIITDSSNGELGRTAVAPTTNLDRPSVQVVATKYFNALGGWVRLTAAQNAGSTMSALAGGATWFEMHKL